MLRGFNSNNVVNPSDAKMVFFSEFLCVQKTGWYGVSSKLSGLGVLVCSIIGLILIFDTNVSCGCLIGDTFGIDDKTEFLAGWAFLIAAGLQFIILSWNLYKILKISEISLIDDINHCRIIKNKNGRYGLCTSGWIRKKSIRILKRMKYDEIVRVSGCSYLVKKNDRWYGIYNSSLKKFIVPLECEHISVAPDGSGLVVIKDNETMRYSFEGFRNFEKENI